MQRLERVREDAGHGDELHGPEHVHTGRQAPVVPQRHQAKAGAPSLVLRLLKHLQAQAQAQRARTSVFQYRGLHLMAAPCILKQGVTAETGVYRITGREG